MDVLCRVLVKFGIKLPMGILVVPVSNGCRVWKAVYSPKIRLVTKSVLKNIHRYAEDVIQKSALDPTPRQMRTLDANVIRVRMKFGIKMPMDILVVPGLNGY